MKDEDDLRELNELLKQYVEATIEERKHLLQTVERAISKVSPGLLETADTRFFNGDYLKDIFNHCMTRVLARPDLSPDRKTNAMEDAESFRAFFDMATQWKVPKLAAHAFEMATLALFTGLRAGLNPKEVENLRVDFARKGGATPKREKPAVVHARYLAREIAEKNPTFSSEKIAEEIPNHWRRGDVACLKHRWLAELIRRWRRNGDVPQAHPLRRQKHPLQRFRR
jgi:hypothetical protein